MSTKAFDSENESATLEGLSASEPLLFEFGAQRLRFEPPHLVWIEFRDPICAAEVRSSLNTMRQWMEQGRRLYVLLDMSGMADIPRDVRQLGTDSMLQYEALAVYGASFIVRVGATMLIKATQAVKKDFRFPVRFFATKEEACAWMQSLLPQTKRGD